MIALRMRIDCSIDFMLKLVASRDVAVRHPNEILNIFQPTMILMVVCSNKFGSQKVVIE